ncbi:MAG: tail fiber domain-containing protein, partial [Heliobacteriaceae bacterium]|nr:tail fiber domain-containing protein [Heliobacteriaceae bacterium]
MMIVLLVMTIILAAFAPLMTRRMKSNMSAGGSGGGESLWAELTTNGPGIYYGTGNAESVIIGAATKAIDDNARLILNKGANTPNYILFKDGTAALAGLYIDSSSIHFGSIPANKGLYRNTSFGIGALANFGIPDGYYHQASYNTAVGYFAGNSNTIGDYNTFIGYTAGNETTEGSSNTFTGSWAGYYNTTGGSNTFTGHWVGYYNTTGSSNVFTGAGAGAFNTVGSFNTSIGRDACYYVTSGSNKTCLGYNSGPADGSGDATSNTNQVWIGVSDSKVYIPGNLYIGAGTTLVTSDKRLKNIKGENTGGLEKIKQIKVFNYTLKDDKEKTPRVGVIAQDLQKIFPDAVSKGYEGFLAVRTEDILYALVNAVKELDKKIDAAVVSVKEQCRILKRVQDDAAAVQTRVAKLEKEN